MFIDEGSVQRVITFTHGNMKRVAVRLVASGRAGLIPFDELKDDMHILGK
jgi:hypothetical protein